VGDKLGSVRPPQNWLYQRREYSNWPVQFPRAPHAGSASLKRGGRVALPFRAMVSSPVTEAAPRSIIGGWEFLRGNPVDAPRGGN
jgi:hypothetical protein